MALLEAMQDVEPLKQGELDSLCGFYAILNAARLLAYPDKHVHPRRLKDLFRQGVAILSRQRHLKFTLSWGMYTTTWDQLLESFLPEIEEVVGFRIRQHRVFKRKTCHRPSSVAKSIRYHIDLGRPVVLILGGTYDHWTVIGGYSASRLQLFDSYEYRWINARSVTLDAHRHNRPHLILPEATWAFERLSASNG